VKNRTIKCLEEVNQVSQQLLLRILSVQKESQLATQDLVNKSRAATKNKEQQNKSNELDELDELSELMRKRDKLITTLFEENTKEEIAIEIKLLQDMISLDNKLSDQAEQFKKSLTEQVIKIKKGKKIKKSYQQY